MDQEKRKLEQEQHEKPMSMVAMVAVTGLFGGLLWSSLAQFAHYLNFTDVRVNVLLEPWAFGAWKKGWIGTVFSIIALGIISIGVAFVYYWTMRKVKSMWGGAIFGLLLFLLVFYVLNPVFPGIKPISDLSRNTLVTSVCFYLLYGVFVGYSISFEENELQYREKNNTAAAPQETE
ncbi:YqhR family membrane protein [Bacillus massilinigeriensis]|uniref:YqhR family membrane protein n=1 Tax=Bacillus mediterraneensis TaxID=1805474 RepID=UPI0008F8A4C2|nr:YqhR family membrane protein [Bacillus mediterraneensis]